MYGDEERRAFAIAGGLTIVAVAAWLLLVGSCHPAHANPVEKIWARARVVQDGVHGIFRAGGTIDSVEYFPAARYSARRDSAQFWIQVTGFTTEPPESIAARGATISGSPLLDAGGNGKYEWLGTIEAMGLYRERWAQAPGDTSRIGESTGALWKDDGAFVRISYQASAVADVTAWGTDAMRFLDSDGFATDQGSVVLPVATDSTRFVFGGSARDGGLRYVVRTRAVWTAGSDRWLRLEVTRDTTALETLVP